VALYGANGSGKTTVLRALEFVVDMIRNSVQQTRPGFSGCERFSDVESMDRNRCELLSVTHKSG